MKTESPHNSSLIVQTFFEKFDQFADAPDAVGKMRELVRHLAVTGTLVEQDNSDEPALILLEKIAAHKTALAKEGKLRGSTNVAPMSPDETPRVLPSSWTWVRFGEIMVNRDGERIPVSKEERETKAKIYDYYGASGVIDKIDGYLFDKPLLLIGEDGANLINRSTPIAFMARGHYWVNNHAHVLDGISEEFLRYIELHINAINLESYVTGSAQPKMNQAKMNSIPIALPPLAEQKRIVAKVDELMALCDQLEALHQERGTQQAALARASLARFADEPTPGNLNFIFHPTYTITPADLSKSILTLAVQGKLVPQDPNDETAETSSHSEALFDIPASWQWRPLGTLGLCRTGKTPPTSDPSNYGFGFPFIGPGQITPSGNFTASEKTITSKGLENSTEANISDILMVCIGGSIGKAAICREPLGFNQQINSVRLEGDLPEFVYLAVRAEYFQEQVLANASGSATPIINKGKWERIPVPIPPLAEQRRIVAKVEQLMVLVEDLETQLVTSRSIAAKLLSALLAELTGQHVELSKPESPNTDAMKKKTNSSKQIAEFSTAHTIRRLVLRRFAMQSGYRSLEQFDCEYHSQQSAEDEASPVCLVGLNGSGKSNLIEAIADVFCFLELINLPWSSVASDTSRYRKNDHQFELEYTIEDAHGERLIRIRKVQKSSVQFMVVIEGGGERLVESPSERLLLLPRRIIGYSSGLNETVSHPFLRTKTLYSEEVREAAPPEDDESTDSDFVYDTRTLYMDYESNAAIILSNYIFREPAELAVFDEFTRVKGVASFGLRFNRKRAGRSGPNSIVRLTRELRSALESFTRCAGVDFDRYQIAYSLDFQLDEETISRFRTEFKSAENLFMAMHKWSLLNALILSDAQRKVYLTTDVTKGALERPPSVPPSDRVFNIVDLKLNLSTPDIEIDYSGLSDGEHQFMQVFGTALLFSEPGTLFLFDEPESHFNPEWRTKFNLILNSLPNASAQEYIISTHSPFVVSGSRSGNVYKFTRTAGSVGCNVVDFETYGASFDVLLKKLFSIDSMIDQSARAELEQIIKRGNVDEMQAAVEDFAESREKRRLYEALIEDEGKHD